MRLIVLQTKYNERLTSVMRDCLEDLEDDGAHGGVGEGLRALAHQAQQVAFGSNQSILTVRVTFIITIIQTKN